MQRYCKNGDRGFFAPKSSLSDDYSSFSRPREAAKQGVLFSRLFLRTVARGVSTTCLSFISSIKNTPFPMKQFVRLLAAVGLLLVSVATHAQKGSFAVRLSLKSFDCVTKKMVVQVQVKANNADSTFLMGDANYRFRYSTQQLANPTIVSEENFSGNAPASQIAYQSQNLEGSTAGATNGIVSLNTIFAGRAGARQVTTDWATVSCLSFDVLAITGCYTLAWQKDTDFPRTGMNEVIVTSASPFAYTTKNVASARVFENLTVCADQFCQASKAKYGVRLSVKSFDCETKKVVLRVEVRAADAESAFLMGDANYRFNYNATLLTNPQIVSQEAFSSVAPASDNRYTAQNLTGSTENATSGVVSLNVKYSPTGTPTARQVTQAWTTVSCISMDYKGALTNPCFDLNWQTSTDFPKTGMNEVNISGNQYTLTDVATGVEYTKATLCPAQRCAGKVADLSLSKKRISAAQATVGSTAIFKLTVKNDGPDSATNVVITDSLPVALKWLSSSPALTPAGQVVTWSIASIAPGDSVELTINTQILAEGVHFNRAEVTASDQDDPDSTPNNNSLLEDDIAHACVSVPIKLCSNQEITVTVPSFFTNVRWFKGATQVGTGNSINLSEAGAYSISADAGSCPAEGCCPIIIEAIDCCPPNLCIPLVVKKTKSAGKPI